VILNLAFPSASCSRVSIVSFYYIYPTFFVKILSNYQKKKRLVAEALSFKGVPENIKRLLTPRG